MLSINNASYRWINNSIREYVAQGRKDAVRYLLVSVDKTNLLLMQHKNIKHRPVYTNMGSHKERWWGEKAKAYKQVTGEVYSTCKINRS